MTGAQARMARAALRLSVRDLARAAGVSPNTITRVEANQRSNNATIAAIQRALEAAGVAFIPENGGGVGVMFVDAQGNQTLGSKLRSVHSGKVGKTTPKAVDKGRTARGRA